MVQSDPNFDVVDVKADVSENGNLMLTSVTAVNFASLLKVTNVLVL